LNSGIHSTMASLRILGLGLDLSAISKELGVEPSLARRKGEHGLAQTSQSADVWCLDSPHPRSEPLDIHLEWLRHVLVPHYGFLQELQRKCDLSVYCGITIEGDRGRFRVPAEALRLFVELEIDMDLSLIFTGYSDQERLNSGRASANDQVRSEGADASFEISGTTFDVSQISKKLGVEFSQTYPAADASSSKRLSATKLWSLVVPVPRSSELDAHLRWLGTTLLPHVELLMSLKGQSDMLIRCNFVTRSDTGGVIISAEGLRAFTELNIPLEFNAFLIWRELTNVSE
jgi:Domain of unknown function (DUF4279)